MRIVPGDPLYDEYFNQLSKKHKDWLIAGEINMYEGRTGPMLRWSTDNTKKHHPGALVPGTSLAVNPNHGNVGIHGPKGAYKNTNAYKELIKYLIPATEDTDIYGSLGWLLNEGFKQVEGGDVYVDAVCPTDGTHFKVKAYKKGSDRALQTLLEQVLDKPAQRNEVDVRGGVFHEYINTPLENDSIEVYTISPDEAREREVRRLEVGQDD